MATAIEGTAARQPEREESEDQGGGSLFQPSAFVLRRYPLGGNFARFGARTPTWCPFFDGEPGA